MAAGGAAAPVWDWRINGRSGGTTIAPRRVAGARQKRVGGECRGGGQRAVADGARQAVGAAPRGRAPAGGGGRLSLGLASIH